MNVQVIDGDSRNWHCNESAPIEPPAAGVMCVRKLALTCVDIGLFEFLASGVMAQRIMQRCSPRTWPCSAPWRWLQRAPRSTVFVVWRPYRYALLRRCVPAVWLDVGAAGLSQPHAAECPALKLPWTNGDESLFGSAVGAMGSAPISLLRNGRRRRERVTCQRTGVACSTFMLRWSVANHPVERRGRHLTRQHAAALLSHRERRSWLGRPVVGGA